MKSLCKLPCKLNDISKRFEISLRVSWKRALNDHVIKIQSSIKSLGILLDENLAWKEYLNLTENKIAKNIWLIYKAKPYLNKDSLLALYFSYIHSYIKSTFLHGSHERRNELMPV